MDTIPAVTENIGRLLRVQAMTARSAQVEATNAAATALVRAYNSLRAELLMIFDGDDLADFRAEIDRLFTEKEVPQPSGLIAWAHDQIIAEAAIDAQVGLGLLQGWIQGLIDEATLDRRLRFEAEARVREETRGAGFRAAP